MQIYRKDGQAIDADTSFSPILDEQGEIVAIAAMATDITEQKAAQEKIREQTEAIMDLSTPVVRVWENILLLPLVGAMDTTRSQQMTGRMLEEIVSADARVVILDLTGVPVIDTSVARHLLTTVQSARILGAEVIISGFSAEAAQTLAQLGVDFSDLRTRGSLKAAMSDAYNLLGHKVH